MKTYEERKKQFIEEYPFGKKLLEYYGEDLIEAMKAVEDRYIGEFVSLEDYARYYIIEEDIPEYLAYYIDYDRLGRDWESMGDIITFETRCNEVHIFKN